jgi:hypothetical protein
MRRDEPNATALRLNFHLTSSFSIQSDVVSSTYVVTGILVEGLERLLPPLEDWKLRVSSYNWNQS